VVLFSKIKMHCLKIMTNLIKLTEIQSNYELGEI